jgi:DNA-binding NtrC family response regulator
VVPQNDAATMPPVPGSTIYDLERWAIHRTLESVAGSTSKAATILGVSARKIQYKLHEYQSGRRKSDDDEAREPDGETR